MVPFLGGARCVVAYVPYAMVYGPVHIAPLLGRGTHHMGPASVGWYVIHVMFINNHSLVKKTTPLPLVLQYIEIQINQISVKLSRVFFPAGMSAIFQVALALLNVLSGLFLCALAVVRMFIFNVHCHALENGPKYCKLSLLSFQGGLEEHGAPATSVA